MTSRSSLETAFEASIVDDALKRNESPLCQSLLLYTFLQKTTTAAFYSNNRIELDSRRTKHANIDHGLAFTSAPVSSNICAEKWKRLNSTRLSYSFKRLENI